MLVVHHPDQRLHDPDQVFRTGRFIAQPDRAERYDIFLDIVRQDRHEIVQAPLNREIGRASCRERVSPYV